MPKLYISDVIARPSSPLRLFLLSGLACADDASV